MYMIHIIYITCKMGIVTKKLRKREVIFWNDVFVAVAVAVARRRRRRLCLSSLIFLRTIPCVYSCKHFQQHWPTTSNIVGYNRYVWVLSGPTSLDVVGQHCWKRFHGRLIYNKATKNSSSANLRIIHEIFTENSAWQIISRLELGWVGGTVHPVN